MKIIQLVSYSNHMLLFKLYFQSDNTLFITNFSIYASNLVQKFKWFAFIQIFIKIFNKLKYFIFYIKKINNKKLDKKCR